MQRPINSFYPIVKKDIDDTFDFSDDEDDVPFIPRFKGKKNVREPTPASDDSPKAFNLLPIEMNQRIGKYLDCDQDLNNFRRTCKATFDSIDGDGYSFWRRRFLESFEKPLKQVNNKWFRQTYIERKKALNEGAVFALGHSKAEIKCLPILRTLICEAFSERKDGDVDYTSKNVKELRRFVQNHNILQNIFDPQNEKRSIYAEDPVPVPAEPMLQMLQVLLAPFMLEPYFIPEEVFQFPLSQQMAYSTSVAEPIFIGHTGLDINMPWLLHQLNFWKYHLMRETELTLFDDYDCLSAPERPGFWSAPLSQSTSSNIGTHWKGAYGYVDHADIHSIRSGENADYPIQDEFCGQDGNNSLQDITLHLNTARETDWNPVFETALRSLSRPTTYARTRAQHRSSAPDEFSNRASRSFRFTGKGADSNETFLADGWLNPLPAQFGVPGWHRMTMIKYFTDSFGQVDYESLWAYEGVVLPGGQVIVGRWWSPTDQAPEEHYTGPFIQWCVDGAPGLDDEEGEGSREV